MTTPRAIADTATDVEPARAMPPLPKSRAHGAQLPYNGDTEIRGHG